MVGSVDHLTVTYFPRVTANSWKSEVITSARNPGSTSPRRHAIGDAVMMDQEPNTDAQPSPEPPPKHVIPPPDLTKRPPPSPSPLDQLPKSSPSPSASVGDPSARVKLRQAGDPVNLAGEELEGPQIAPFNPRVAAAFIDSGVGLGVTLGLSWLFHDSAEWLAQLVGMAYFVTRDSLPFFGGQSVGKKAMKLKVSTLDGKSLVGNWQAALIRNGILLIPFVALLELYILLSRENGVGRGRRLGDEWAKTRVLVEEDLPPPGED